MDNEQRRRAEKYGVGGSSNSELAKWLLRKADEAQTFTDVATFVECAARLDEKVFADWYNGRVHDEELDDEEDDGVGFVTIHQLAIHRGMKSSNVNTDTYNEQDYFAVGLPIMGGCERCEATIASYNAYPSLTGYIRCAECVQVVGGYRTVEEANAAIFADPPHDAETERELGWR